MSASECSVSDTKSIELPFGFFEKVDAEKWYEISSQEFRSFINYHNEGRGVDCPRPGFNRGDDSAE